MDRKELLKEMLKRKFAHRGLHDEVSCENSLSAFKKAVDANYPIELDLHLSKDKEVMVFHDDNLVRITGKDALIHELTFTELRSLKLKDSNETIPTFKEVLDLVDGKVSILIEFKTMGKLNEELVDKTFELLKDYKGIYFTQSFDPILMGIIKKKHPEVLRGQLVGDFEDTDIKGLKKFLLKNMILNIFSLPDFITTDFHYYPSFMKRLRKRKLILCYTIRSEEDLKLSNVFDNIIFEKIRFKGE